MVGIPWVKYNLEHFKISLTIIQVVLSCVIIMLIFLGIMTYDRLSIVEQKMSDGRIPIGREDGKEETRDESTLLK